MLHEAFIVLPTCLVVEFCEPNSMNIRTNIINQTLNMENAKKKLD